MPYILFILQYYAPSILHMSAIYIIIYISVVTYGFIIMWNAYRETLCLDHVGRRRLG